MKKTTATMLVTDNAVDVVPEKPRPPPLFADFVRARAAVRPGDPHVFPVRPRMTRQIERISIWSRLARRLRTARF